ncbi:MAG: ferritin-like domain-containing protein [Solirubrobacteraceae bacterium]
MTHTTTAAQVPAMSAHVREETGNQLPATLVELLDLSLVGKQSRWSIVGPHFRPLHEQLDELVDSWHELADVVAESSRTAPVDRGAVHDELALAQIVQRVAEVAESTREEMDRLAELDVVSQDVPLGVVRQLEQQLWMIRSQIPNGRAA